MIFRTVRTLAAVPDRLSVDFNLSPICFHSPVALSGYRQKKISGPSEVGVGCNESFTVDLRRNERKYAAGGLKCNILDVNKTMCSGLLPTPVAVVIYCRCRAAADAAAMETDAFGKLYRR